MSENRPLIRNLQNGVLVSQRSDTPLSVEYRGKAIRADPFLLSNSAPIVLTYGSEIINIPASGRGNNHLRIPAGNASLLALKESEKAWEQYWEEWMPTDMRPFLILLTIVIQLFMLIAPVLTIADYCMRRRGYEVRPFHDRSLRKRYFRRAGTPVDNPQVRHGFHYEMDEIDNQDSPSRPMTPKSILSNKRSHSSLRSDSSAGSRNRRQTLRALQRQLLNV